MYEQNKTRNGINRLNNNDRNLNIKKNIISSSLLKIFGLGLSYLVVPLTLSYLNNEKYGVWLILLSMLSWISFMDIGLGNGLRNRLTESLSNNDIRSAKEYISTAYAVMVIIASVLLFALIIVVLLADWNSIFNTKDIAETELTLTVSIVIVFFMANFILSLSNQLFYSVQESAFTGLTAVLLNGTLLVIILILSKTTDGSLIFLSLAYGMAMVISGAIMTALFFFRYKELKPSLKSIKKDKINKILQLGISFFIIQISAVIIFTTDNMIITQLFGPSEVTPYNIVKKLFNIIIMGHTIVVTPLWSAYTEANIKKDFAWMRQTLKKTNYLMIIIIVAISTLVLLSKPIINIWIGSDVDIPVDLVLVMGLYTIIHVWNNNYAYLLNGIGRVRISSFVATIGALFNIPISILLASYFNLGTTGVITGTIFSLLLFSISGPIETYYVLNKQNHKNNLSKE